MVDLKEEERGIKDDSWVLKIVPMIRLICSAYPWVPILMSNGSYDGQLKGVYVQCLCPIKMDQKAHGSGWMDSVLQGLSLPNKRQSRRIAVLFSAVVIYIRLSFKLTLLPPWKRHQVYSLLGSPHTSTADTETVPFSSGNPTRHPLTQRHQSQGPGHTK